MSMWAGGGQKNAQPGPSSIQLLRAPRYDILALPRGCSKEDIKPAFRILPSWPRGAPGSPSWQHTNYMFKVPSICRWLMIQRCRFPRLHIYIYMCDFWKVDIGGWWRTALLKTTVPVEDPSWINRNFPSEHECSTCIHLLCVSSLQLHHCIACKIMMGCQPWFQTMTWSSGIIHLFGWPMGYLQTIINGTKERDGVAVG